MDRVSAFAGELLPEPLQCLTFPQASERRLGGAADLGAPIAPCLMQTGHDGLAAQRFPPAETAEPCRANFSFLFPRGGEQDALGFRRRKMPQDIQHGTVRKSA